MVVSNINTILGTCVTELEKQQAKMEYTAGETVLRYLVSVMRYQMKI